MPSSHLILCHPLFLLPPIPPSIRVLSNESTLCMRWPKYWSFSLNISSSPSVQFSHSVLSDSLQPHGLKHARPPCPSPTPGVYPNPCAWSWWRHPAVSSSVIPFSSCRQSFPASGFFQMSQLFAWGGQSIGVSALASVPPMNTQDWFPLGLISLISLKSKGLSRESSPTPQFKSINSSALSLLYDPTRTSIHDYWKNHSFKSMVLCFHCQSI